MSTRIQALQINHELSFWTITHIILKIKFTILLSLSPTFYVLPLFSTFSVSIRVSRLCLFNFCVLIFSHVCLWRTCTKVLSKHIHMYRVLFSKRVFYCFVVSVSHILYVFFHCSLCFLLLSSWPGCVCLASAH